MENGTENRIWECENELRQRRREGKSRGGKGDVEHRQQGVKGDIKHRQGGGEGNKSGNRDVEQ